VRPCSSTVTSGSDGDGDILALLDKERNTGLALGLAEERDGAEEEQEEVVDIDPRLRRLPQLRRVSSGSAAWGRDWLHRLGSEMRGSEVRGRMSSRGGLQRGRGFLSGRGGRGAGCTSTVAIGRGWRCFWSGVVS
jgi:hypothetical protein